MATFPRAQLSLQIEEVDTEAVFASSFGHPRIDTLRKQRECQSCGLYGNRMFRDWESTDRTTTTFNLYAETRYKDKEPILVLMSKDHIVSRRCGGKDTPENYQTLCVACNRFKDIFEGRPYNNSLLQSSLSIACFVSKATYSRNLTLANLAPAFSSQNKKIQQILRLKELVKDLNVAKPVIEEILSKIEYKEKELQELRHRIHLTLLRAQTTGLILTDLDPLELLEKADEKR